MDSSPVMVSLFDRSGVMAAPWAAAGCLCYCVDLQHPAGETREGNLVRVGCDAREWRLPAGEIVFFAAFPPCTHLSVSGARWFAGKGLRALAEAIGLFAVAAELAQESGAPYLIENPVSTISTYWREPDYTFHPWQYGDAWTKKTCLWTGGGFVMPPPTCEMELASVSKTRIHHASPGPWRANLRSETPPGFARAVFESNCVKRV